MFILFVKVTGLQEKLMKYKYKKYIYKLGQS